MSISHQNSWPGGEWSHPAARAALKSTLLSCWRWLRKRKLH